MAREKWISQNIIFCHSSSFNENSWSTFPLLFYNQKAFEYLRQNTKSKPGIKLLAESAYERLQVCNPMRLYP